jgi:two-component system NtrC family sensor kinase
MVYTMDMKHFSPIRLRSPGMGTHLTWLHSFFPWVEVLEWEDCFLILERKNKEIPFIWVERQTLTSQDTKQVMRLKKQYPHCPIFLILPTLSQEKFQTLVAKKLFWQIGTLNTPHQTWKSALRKALEEFHHRAKQSFWSDLIRQRNLKLLRMTHSLENQVQRKTTKLFLSTKRLSEQESQLERIQSLLVQINAANTIDEIYACLSGQLAHILPFTELSILTPDWSGKGFVTLTGTGSGDIQLDHLPEEEEKQVLKHFNGLEIVNLLDRNKLKEILKTQVFALKRHFNILLLPLSVGRKKGAIFISSHDRNAFEEKHLDALRHLQPPLSVALERVYIMGSLRHLQEQWAVTFNAIQSPIIILNEDLTISRTNLAADNLIREFPELETQWENGNFPQKISNNERVFHLFRHPFEHKGKHLSLLNFREITEEQDLLQQLLQSEKLASVGTLSEKVAHELNNPLAGILALCQILLEDVDGPLKEDLKEIEKACQRCKHIIENLVEFSRSNQSSKTTWFSLNKVIEETLLLARAGLTGVELKVKLDPRLPAMKGQFQELQQVIFNLIQNSSQAMQGKGKLSLSTTLDPIQKSILIYIRDTGEGITEENWKKVFDPFFTTKRAGVGTGLGLSICKKIVEAHRGEIKLSYSKPGEGTEFCLSFPSHSAG